MKINKKIKFWIFYIIKDNDYGYENEIYAYTNDKSLYELFIKTRKMDMFYVKSIKLTKDEMNDLYKEYTLQYLELYKGLTLDTNSYSKINIEIPLTKNEISFCNNLSVLYIDNYLYRYAWYSPYIFKNKYINALNDILYISVNDYIYEGRGYDEGDDEIENKVKVNSIKLIMNATGNTLKI